MYALQPSPLDSQSRPTARRRPRSRSSKTHQSLKAEVALKLAANTVLSVIAIAALVKLIPYQLAQQEKLKEVRVEVHELETRVNQLRANFSRNFDASQAKKVMQEQSPRIDPNQRRIVWVKQ